MPELEKTWLNDTTLRVMTYKSGSFTFSLAIDMTQLQAMFDRVNDAQIRFNKMPMLPEIVDAMQERTLASSIYSTNIIEGGRFTPEETAQILKRSPEQIQNSEEKRLTNLKSAIEWVKNKASRDFQPLQGQTIVLADILHLHRLVSQDIDEKNNPSAQFRNNQTGQKNIVGNENTGGTYRPPKCLADIEFLMHSFLEWLNSPAILKQPALIRASLAHYYFELIHPFWDGNGRTGRLLEMLILEQSGYQFSSSAIWQYYQQHIYQYFALFNHCRQQQKQKNEYALHDFVKFLLEGMLDVINELHDQSNILIKFLLFRNSLFSARQNKILNESQVSLIEIYLASELSLTLRELYHLPPVQSLYANKTERTFYRDIEKLLQLGFLKENLEHQLVFG